jgi:hypothetical protein
MVCSAPEGDRPSHHKAKPKTPGLATCPQHSSCAHRAALGFCSLVPDRVGAYGQSFFLSETQSIPGFANLYLTSNLSWSVAGVARASRPLWEGHFTRALMGLDLVPARPLFPGGRGRLPGGGSGTLPPQRARRPRYERAAFETGMRRQNPMDCSHWLLRKEDQWQQFSNGYPT